VNATIIPFHVAPGLKETPLKLDDFEVAASSPRKPAGHAPLSLPSTSQVDGAQPISTLQWRSRARVVGRLKSVRIQPLSDVPTMECVLVDSSGEAITLAFLGRRSIAGFQSGAVLMAEGMVGKHRGKLAMINPSYELLSPAIAEATH
jgi:hypothetical protein